MPLDPAAERTRARRKNPRPGRVTVALRPFGFFVWALFCSAVFASLVFVFAKCIDLAVQSPHSLRFEWTDWPLALASGVLVGYFTVIGVVWSLGLALAQWTHFARSLRRDFAGEELSSSAGFGNAILLPVRRTVWTGRVYFLFWLGMTPPLGLAVAALVFGLAFRLVGQWPEPANLVLIVGSLVGVAVLAVWAVSRRAAVWATRASA